MFQVFLDWEKQQTSGWMSKLFSIATAAVAGGGGVAGDGRSGDGDPMEAAASNAGGGLDFAEGLSRSTFLICAALLTSGESSGVDCSSSPRDKASLHSHACLLPLLFLFSLGRRRTEAASVSDLGDVQFRGWGPSHGLGASDLL